jgi:hypothetical protein
MRSRPRCDVTRFGSGVCGCASALFCGGAAAEEVQEGAEGGTCDAACQDPHGAEEALFNLLGCGAGGSGFAGADPAMIGKISKRGTRIAGLIYYLYGPGRHEAHTDPHIVAGWRHPAELEPPRHPSGHRDFRHLAGLLQQPHDALGPRGFANPVWHCSVRAAPEDRMLSDGEWAQLARDIMHHTGLAPHGHDDDAVRWIAVRHAPDHIHLVAMLARQDGTRPRLWNDYYRVGEACRAAEERYGLRRTASRDRTAAPRPTRAESEKARRRAFREPPRIKLRRAVSTAAGSAATEEEFFTRLAEARLLIRKRFSTRTFGEVTGYAVALPADTTSTGEPVWFSGGKLAPALTLPKLRRRWDPIHSPTAAHQRNTPVGQNAIWDHAARAAAEATHRIRLLAATDPSAAADAAWAAADVLHVAASTLRSNALHQAADSFDRAARAPFGRIPRSTRTGNSLRRAARQLSTLAAITGDPTLAQITLIVRLTVLIETIASLREAQRHTAQAAAAHQAAQHLHAMRTVHAAHLPHQRTRPRRPASLAALGVPFSPFHPQTAATDPPSPHVPTQPRAHPSRRPRPQRHRGPAP